MKKALTIIWNLTLILLVALAASFMIPRILGQFQGLDRLSEGSFRTRSLMFGIQGIALCVVMAAGALSFSSVFWRKVSWPWRGFFITIVAVSCVGALIAIRIDRADMGFVIYGDYVAFVLGTFAIAFPIIAWGIGYPLLLLRIYRRIRGKNPAAGESTL